MTLYWNTHGDCVQGPSEHVTEVKPGDVFRFDDGNTYTVTDTLDPCLVAVRDGRPRQFHHTRATRVTETTCALWWRGTTEGDTSSVFDVDGAGDDCRQRVRRGDPVRVNGIGEYTVLDVVVGNRFVLRNEDSGAEHRVDYGSVTYRDLSRTRDTDEVEAAASEVTVDVRRLYDHVGKRLMFTFPPTHVSMDGNRVSIGCQSDTMSHIVSCGGAIIGTPDGLTVKVPGLVRSSCIYFDSGHSQPINEVAFRCTEAVLIEGKETGTHVRCAPGVFRCAATGHDHAFTLFFIRDEPGIVRSDRTTYIRKDWTAWPDCQPVHSVYITYDESETLYPVACTPEHFPDEEHFTP